jgi:hypothetical protein
MEGQLRFCRLDAGCDGFDGRYFASLKFPFSNLQFVPLPN